MNILADKLKKDGEALALPPELIDRGIEAVRSIGLSGGKAG